MRTISVIATTILLLAFLTACERPDPAPGSRPAAEQTSAGAAAQDKAPGIEWFAGSVSDAFAHAKAERKPVFLYWGAEWCPPCHAIKATVFRSHEFIERSKLFVPVYLDGDTENAQAIGENFGVLGYPTMIVFDPDGKELTRIPGGIDIQAYASVLDLTLGSTASAISLVHAVIEEGQNLDVADCRLLTHYAWNQDRKILQDYEEQDAHRQIYEACPTELTLERSVLYMNHLDAAIDAIDSEMAEVPLSEEQKAEGIEYVQRILADPELTKANIFPILFSGARITEALTEEGSAARDDLAHEFHATLDRLATDDSVYKRERIYTGIGKIYLERMGHSDAEISDELKAEISNLVNWADESTPDPYERQSIINAASNLLDEAGMTDIARPLLLAELKRSKQPYYFMVSLADIEQNAGNYEAAITWLKRAYEAARGPATRFQWGYYYINGLIEMVPEDAARIHRTTIDVIRELEAASGIHQRPKAQLARLESKLTEWSKSQKIEGTLQDIRSDVLVVCARLPAEEASQNTCRAFLESA